MSVCLKCNSYLSKKRIKNIPISECPSCGSIWVQGHFFEKFKSKFSLAVEDVSSRKNDENSFCKDCSNQIDEKRIITKGGKEKIFQCSHCKGMFFTGRVLQKIEKLSNLFNRVFTEKRNEKLKKRNKRKEVLSKIYNTDKPVSKDLISVRNDFIGKVYRLFVLSLLTAGIGAYLGYLLKLSDKYFWPIIIIELLVILVTRRLKRIEPINLILLFFFTTYCGFSTFTIINVWLAPDKGIIVFYPLGITISLFTLLTVYVFKSKRDFNFLGNFLLCSLILLIYFLSGIFLELVYFNDVILLFFGLVLYIGCVLYSTSKVILKYNTEEYVAATLDLYIDFINIFSELIDMKRHSSDTLDYIE